MKLSFRPATAADVRLYFDWVNDPEVRRLSYRSEPIPFEAHAAWFNEKMAKPDCLLLVFETETQVPVGQVRIERRTDQPALIGVSVDRRFRGQGCGSDMIAQATDCYHRLHPRETVAAHIMVENEGSLRAFQRAGYVVHSRENIHGRDSLVLWHPPENL